MAEYELRIKSRAGVELDRVSDFLSLGYSKVVNGPGLLVFELEGSHRAIADLTLSGQVEVWRREPLYAVDWYCDFYGLFRQPERWADGNGAHKYRGHAPGQLDWLAGATIDYSANIANRSTFSVVKAETIAKTLVTRNATTSGTTGDGRRFNVDAWGAFISVQADGATGNAISYNCAYRNLLQALQEIALIGGGDFDLIKTGAQAWEFRWYAGQRGSDKSSGTSQVLFALERGNMENPHVTQNRLGEATVCVAGGEGEEAARTVVRRTGANYDATYNSRSVFLQASQYSTTAGLNAAADERLDELQARNDFTFGVLQVPSTVYHRDYDIGDLVYAKYQDIEGAKKIVEVSISFEGSGDKPENIRVGLADV